MAKKSKAKKSKGGKSKAKAKKPAVKAKAKAKAAPKKKKASKPKAAPRKKAPEVIQASETPSDEGGMQESMPAMPPPAAPQGDMFDDDDSNATFE